MIQHIERLRSLEGEQAFALLYVDVDDFKKVNDSLGHEAGDALLVQLADRLRLVTQNHAPAGAQTFMARLGGDEFVVVLLDPKAERTAIDFAECIQQELRRPFSLGNDKIFVSGSIGISFGKGGSHLSQELLRDADTAMYRAKIQGRARYEVFHRDMHAQAVEKLQLDARLRQAIEHDELELWYQPILNLRTGRVTSAEALIRWRHPEQGFVGARSVSGRRGRRRIGYSHQRVGDQDRLPQRRFVASVWPKPDCRTRQRASCSRAATRVRGIRRSRAQ